MTSHYITALFGVVESFSNVFKSIFWTFEYNLLQTFPGPSMEVIIDFIRAIPVFGDFLDYSLFDFAFLSVIAIVLAQILIFIKNLVFGD